MERGIETDQAIFLSENKRKKEMWLKRNRYRREWEKHEFLGNAQRRRISHKEISIDKKSLRMRTGKYPFALATRKLLYFINTWVAGKRVNDGWVREHGVECIQCSYDIKGSNLFKHLFRAISIAYGSQRKIFFFFRWEKCEHIWMWYKGAW